MITMSKNDYEIILKHARENLPEEACGLIAGTKDGNDKSIQKIYCLTNIDHSNEPFSLDPERTARSSERYARQRSGTSWKLAFSSGKPFQTIRRRQETGL